MIDKEINSLKLLKKELKGAFQVKISSTIPNSRTLITVWETPDSEAKYILTHNKVSNVINIIDVDTYLDYEGEKKMEEKTIPKKRYCVKCDKCEFNTTSGKRDNICFNYEFWHDDVLAGKEHHFVDAEGHVYSMTSKENGGFGGQGYDVELRDGTKFENIGLWHRGEAPSSVRKQLIRGERTPVYRR